MFHDVSFYIAGILLILSGVAVVAAIKLSRELKQIPPDSEDAKRKKLQGRLQLVALFLFGMIGELIGLLMILKVAFTAIATS